MKTLLLTFVLSLFCACAFPQKITGKWTCEKEVVKTLQMGYDDLYCTYKFKKNGVMIIKIKGQTVFDHDPYNYERDHIRSGSIKIKGHYEVKEGKISSIVVNDDVECFADEYNPPREENGMKAGPMFVGDISREANYKKNKSLHLRKKLLDYRFLWDWDNEPITITKEELVIGDKLKCRR